MKKTAIAIISILSVLNFSTCTVFKKSISKPITINLADTLFNPEIMSTAVYSKYTDNVTPQQVASAFLKGFLNEAKYTNNVTLKFNDENADFTLKLKFIKVIESSKTEKINDSKSPFNGQDVLLNEIDVSAEFQITNNKNKSKNLLGCFNRKQRAEKVTNNRDIGDLITGQNKGHTKYRTKLLSENIVTNLSEDVGRRIWVPITRRIAKQLK